MPCPDENSLTAMVEGTLSPAEQEALGEHLDQCEACSGLVVELARVLVSAGPSAQAGAERLEDVYSIGEVIGQGGMGAVYEGTHRTLGRKVAIKLLRADMTDPTLRQIHAKRLLREAQLLASLSHPNIVTVFDTGVWKGEQIFLVMELVDGSTVRAWQNQSARSWQEILGVYLQAASGLEAAHAAGIVHRDIKPENLLIGRDGRVRVTDFGLARGQEAPDAAPSQRAPRAHRSVLTLTGDVLGTPAYMAPEQHLGAYAGPPADQFSLCVALWEALCGERPFAGSTRSALAAEVCAGRLRAVPAGVSAPPSLLETLRRGLRPSPQERWPSMNAFIAALRGATESKAPRRVWPALLGGMVLVAGASGALFFLWWRGDFFVTPDPGGSRKILPSNAYEEAGQAYERGSQAYEKGDFKTCLAELKRAGELAEQYKKATEPRVAECVMMSGDCARGSEMYRDYLRGKQLPASQIEATVRELSKRRCRARP